MGESKYLGVDLGGTAVKIAVVEKTGKVIDKALFDTKVELGPDWIIENIIKGVRAIIAKNNLHKVKSVGLGVAGDVDQKNGVVRYSPNLMWENIRLRESLRKKLDYPMIVENDANAAAWGAYIVETRRKVRNLVAITLGTGVGGGIIINGKLYRGSSGSAGEIGHMTLYPDGPKCKCGNKGCVERYLGAAYLLENIKETIKKEKNSKILTLVDGDVNRVTPLVIEGAARIGDKYAIEYYDDLGLKLGIALASLINLLNPEMIVISGGISKAGNLIRESLVKEINKRAFKSAREAVQIVFSKNDRDMGVIGAALLE